MSRTTTDLLYLVTIVTFILALRFLSSPKRARQGNLLGAAGMALAIGVTLTQDGSHFIVSYGPTTDVVEISPRTLSPARDSVLTQSFLSGSHVFNWTRMTGHTGPIAA